MTSQELDQYGGWKKVKHQGTGFFRLEYIDNRWWLIDPEGNVFLSLGINHVKPELLARNYNRAHSEKKYGPLPKPFSVGAFKQTKGWQVWFGDRPPRGRIRSNPSKGIIQANGSTWT